MTPELTQEFRKGNSGTRCQACEEHHNEHSERCPAMLRTFRDVIARRTRFLSAHVGHKLVKAGCGEQR
jgi:hypothetical protein